MNVRDIRTIVEDLEYLRTVWNGSPGDPELRRGSAILRRLLVDGSLERAWRALGFRGEFRISAPNIDSIMLRYSGPRIAIFLALGAKYQGCAVTSIYVQVAHEGQERTPIPFRADGPDTSSYTIRNYLNSSSGIKQDEDEKTGRLVTTKISRSDVIKYIANNGGGVHVGDSRHAKGRRIAERVSQFHWAMDVFGKDSLFYEILAIGQCLGNSPSTDEMIGKFRRAG